MTTRDELAQLISELAEHDNVLAIACGVVAIRCLLTLDQAHIYELLTKGGGRGLHPSTPYVESLRTGKHEQLATSQD